MSQLPATIDRPGELAVQPGVGNQLLDVIRNNPAMGAENVKALLDGVERVMKWEAERDFTAAFARLKFPPIKKSKKGANGKYAALDGIQEIIDPILASEGFVMTYSGGEPNAKGEVPTFGHLSHVGGHSRDGVLYLPPDGVDTKAGGRNMNALQAIGSTTSYGMRYVAKMMLNLRFVGEDNDGAGQSITPNEREQISRAILETGANESKLLEIYGVKTLADLPRICFKGVQAQINQKLRAARRAEAYPEAEIEAEVRKLWFSDAR